MTHHQRFSEVADWLKEKDADLEAAVLVESGQKPILFGRAYKVVLKSLTKIDEYVV